MSANKEVRAYMKSSNANIAFGGMGICFVVLQLIAISSGTFTKTLPIFLAIYVILGVVWYVQRKGVYIAVDMDKETLNGARFFGLPPKEIPIASIIRIGTRGMFVGGLTVMTVTYLLPSGKEKTVNAGGKQSFYAVQFQKILDALVEINPKIHIPSELRS
jgi:RsiW-degrading membrane proteinase PrsW (M82 family)